MTEKKSWKPQVSAAAQATLANGLLWDVIGQLGWKIPIRVPADVMGRPTIHGSKRIRLQHLVVQFKGHYYGADGNPWPRANRVTTLVAKRGNPLGDLYITSVGAVSTVKGSRVVGVQDDVQPVAIRLARAGHVAEAEGAAVPGAGAGPDDEQCPGGIPGRLPGGDQPELSAKGGH